MATENAYERERQARIQKNRELLASLNLDKFGRSGTPSSSADDTASKPKPKPKPKPKAKPDTSGLVLPARVTRSNAARTVALEKKDPEAAKRKREEEERQAREEEELKRRRRHADRDIEVWNSTGREILPDALIPLKRSLETIATSGTWPRGLHPSIKRQSDAPNGVKQEGDDEKQDRKKPRSTPSRRAVSKASVKKEESDEEEEASEGSPLQYYVDDEYETKDSIGYKSLAKTFNKMTLRASKKATPDRIYSALIHPTEDKDLLFLGDRKGWLGIWDASADTEEMLKSDERSDDGDDADYDKNCFVQRVFNDHGTISCMRLDPIKGHSLYTSSYDCTIRGLNFETGVWHEAVDVDMHAADDHGEGQALISGFDVTHDGRIIWASDNAGGVTRQDLRAPTSAGQRWKVSESKAGCISLNPANENYFATAHLNRDVRIWDARKMRAITDWQDADYHQVYANASMADYEHGHACSSAYWDPSGRHLLTSSYDDRLRIWNLHPNRLREKDLENNFKPDYKVYHDNKVGAYVSVFKATWAPNVRLEEPFFTIGNMKRSLDIYDKKGRLISQHNQGLSSVPAVTAAHPSLPVFVGGAAGGKAYYWKADKWE